MDKNSIIGLSLIGLIIIGYSIYTQPGPEEIRAIQNRRDSIAKIEEQKRIASVKELSPVTVDSVVQLTDSENLEIDKLRLGEFASTAEGAEQLLTLENNYLRVIVSSKGGKIKSAELKNYKTWDGKPLKLRSR